MLLARYELDERAEVEETVDDVNITTQHERCEICLAEQNVVKTGRTFTGTVTELTCQMCYVTDPFPNL